MYNQGPFEPPVSSRDTYRAFAFSADSALPDSLAHHDLAPWLELNIDSDSYSLTVSRSFLLITLTPPLRPPSRRALTTLHRILATSDALNANLFDFRLPSFLAIAKSLSQCISPKTKPTM